MTRTRLIAEAGSCHDGDFIRALRLVDVAAEAGADACKFQYWSSAERLAERRHAQDHLEAYRKYQVPREWLGKLEAYCLGHGIEFMCTCYLPEDLEIVVPHVKHCKIASFEASDIEFCRAHLRYGKEVIISTGMATWENLAWAFSVPRDRIKFLHCVSAYPAPASTMNLGVLKQIMVNEGNRYPQNLRDGPAYLRCHGLSDHSANIITGGFAVCAGAEILEVHVRLPDTDSDNPDYPHSLTPDGLKAYVELARMAEKMMGDGLKRPQPSETPMMKYRVTA